jgi:putative hydrolase of the HAD superfamily
VNGANATKGVLFDAGGTLFHRVPSTQDCIAEALRRLGENVPPSTLHAAFHAALREEPVPEPGAEAAAWRDFNATILRHAGIGPRPELVAAVGLALEEAKRELYPDVVPTLARLRRHNLKLAVVSNFTHTLPTILDQLGITSYFDAILYSWKAGFAKPDARMYGAALRAVGLRAEETVMVGDSYETDVEGPLKCGIRGILLARNRRAIDGGIASKVETVSTLLDLPRLLALGAA